MNLVLAVTTVVISVTLLWYYTYTCALLVTSFMCLVIHRERVMTALTG